MTNSGKRYAYFVSVLAELKKGTHGIDVSLTYASAHLIYDTFVVLRLDGKSGRKMYLALGEKGGFLYCYLYDFNGSPPQCGSNISELHSHLEVYYPPVGVPNVLSSGIQSVAAIISTLSSVIAEHCLDCEWDFDNGIWAAYMSNCKKNIGVHKSLPFHKAGDFTLVAKDICLYSLCNIHVTLKAPGSTYDFLVSLRSYRSSEVSSIRLMTQAIAESTRSHEDSLRYGLDALTFEEALSNLAKDLSDDCDVFNSAVSR